VISVQYNLGLMYLNGDGVERHYMRAFAWFYLARSQGTDVARKALDQLSVSMVDEQYAEAQALAKEWAAKHNKK